MKTYPSILLAIVVQVGLVISTTRADVAEKFQGSKAGDEREVAGIKLCWCPPGKFLMGSPPDESERRPGEDQVEVTLTKGFWMAKFEATQAEWKRVVGMLPGPLTEELPEGDDYPVGNVNFAETELFCRKLTELAPIWRAAWRLGISIAHRSPVGVRLSRRDDDSHVVWQSAQQQAGEFQGQALQRRRAGPALGRAAKVGSYPPNAWGLHDMHGNTYEWCRDWYHAKLPGGVDPDLYDAWSTAQFNRTGDKSRVRRGGAWTDDGWVCRSAFRVRFEPERRYDHIGFRVVTVQP